MNTSISTLPSAPSSIIPASPMPFVPLDFLQQFVPRINNGEVFRTANGQRILSTIKEKDVVTPAQVRQALEIVVGYFKSPGRSPEMNLDRVQQLTVYLAEIVKHQHLQCPEIPARFTTYELGNAATALQQVLRSQLPTGNN